MSAGHRKHVDHCLNCAAPTPGAYCPACGQEAVDAAVTCLNCAAPTPGAYCPACGQEAVDAAVTFRDQIAHFFEEVFTVEARLPQTVKILVMRPGALTRAYNSGQRVRFVTPLKLYLLASVTFFLLLSLSASRAAPELHSQPAVQGGQTTAEGFSLRIVPPPGEKPRDTPTVAPIKTPEEFDAWLANPKNAKAFPPFLLPHIRALLKSPNGFVGSLIDLCSKATIALVPIHALLLTLRIAERGASTASTSSFRSTSTRSPTWLTPSRRS